MIYCSVIPLTVTPEQDDALWIVLGQQDAAIPQVSFGPTNRITWGPFIGGNAPHGIPEIPMVFVSVENPYHLRDVPRMRTFVNAYTDSEMVADVVVDALTGVQPFRGQNPVDPFCGYEDTHW